MWLGAAPRWLDLGDRLQVLALMDRHVQPLVTAEYRTALLARQAYRTALPALGSI